MILTFPKERHTLVSLFLNGVKPKQDKTQPRKQLRLF